jgi:predicted DNA-binding transcriptional regulator YafY
MPLNKKQIIRLIKIVSELKQNNLPNRNTLAELFRKADLEENINISCCAETIGRDIKALKEDFNAPIEFDSIQNGYRLTNKNWEFECPLQCDKLLTSSLFGARIAEDIAPVPLKNEIRNAIDHQLTTNNSEFLDEAFMQSLIIASGIKAEVSPENFKILLDGWRNHEAIRFSYRKPNGEKTDRYFEPHIISFHNGAWYTKGINLPDERELVFAIQRMEDIELSGKYFEVSKDLIDRTNKEGLFNYPRIKGIKVLCHSSIAYYLYEQQSSKNFKIEEQENGDLILELAPAIEHEAIKWILGEAGKIRVLEPESLKQKIARAGECLMKANS